MVILRTIALVTVAPFVAFAIALCAAGLALKTGWATLAGLIADCTQWTPAHK